MGARGSWKIQAELRLAWVRLRRSLRLASPFMRRWAALGLTVFAIELVYVFIISGGRFTTWPLVIDYYDQLAEAFRAGQLHLKLEPSPELLAKSDPYGLENIEISLGDASLYRGKYYLYWGPVPALIQALVKQVLGIDRIVGDHYLLFGFQSLSLVSGTVLLERVSRRFFPSLPLSLVVAAVASFGLANPAPFVLAWARMYEDAIMGGQAFFLLGALLAFEVVYRSRFGPISRLRWLGVGAAWALAIGCRASLGPGIAIATLATVVAASAAGTTPGPRFRRWLEGGFWLGLPIALMGGALLLYNRLRFDDWLDFGMAKQLTIWPFRFSSRYLLPNALSYLLRMPAVTCEFPYVRPSLESASSPLARYFPDPAGYELPEQLVGMLIAVPAVWPLPLSLASAAATVAAWSRAERLNDVALPRVRLWLVICFSAVAALSTFGPGGIRIATMRYLGDVTNACVLLAVFGLWLLHSRVAERVALRRVVVGIGIALAVATAVIGTLLGYQGYVTDFETRYDPDLHRALSRALSLCPRSAAGP